MMLTQMKKFKQFLKVFLFLSFAIPFCSGLAILPFFFATLVHPVFGIFTIWLFVAAVASFIMVMLDE